MPASHHKHSYEHCSQQFELFRRACGLTRRDTTPFIIVHENLSPHGQSVNEAGTRVSTAIFLTNKGGIDINANIRIALVVSNMRSHCYHNTTAYSNLGPSRMSYRRTQPEHMLPLTTSPSTEFLLLALTYSFPAEPLQFSQQHDSKGTAS